MIVQPCATENPQIPDQHDRRGQTDTSAHCHRVRLVAVPLDVLIREHQAGALGLGDPCPEHRHKCHTDGLDLQAEIYQRMRTDKEGDTGRNAGYHLILLPSHGRFNAALRK